MTFHCSRTFAFVDDVETRQTLGVLIQSISVENLTKKEKQNKKKIAKSLKIVCRDVDNEITVFYRFRNKFSFYLHFGINKEKKMWNSLSLPSFFPDAFRTKWNILHIKWKKKTKTKNFFVFLFSIYLWSVREKNIHLNSENFHFISSFLFVLLCSMKKYLTISFRYGSHRIASHSTTDTNKQKKRKKKRPKNTTWKIKRSG